ncbi:MAG TPA: hypothetical protein VGU64_06520 [Terriglobales bacterium]|nr:hypothetical protein [Terriglobales bacterium]
MNIGFERITPTPGYPVGTSAAALKGLRWRSGATVVELFKDGVKVSLRTAQLGRCCFCRRHLYDDYATHIEHFVDKAQYPDYSFEIRNLALSCGTCNIRKSAHFSSWAARYRFFTRGFVGPLVPRSPVLNVQLKSGDKFPVSQGDFSWVNPHVHDYSWHIKLTRGWVFGGRSPEGRRTIRGLKLNDVGEIERRALTERLEMRGGKLSMLVGALASLDQHRASEVARAAIAVINRRRKAAATGGR